MEKIAKEFIKEVRQRLGFDKPKKTKFIFCDCVWPFADWRETVDVNTKDGGLDKAAKVWATEHNLKHVFVYTENRDFLWDYKL